MTNLFEESLNAKFLGEGEPEPEVIETEYDQPDGNFVGAKWRSPVAKKYEKKSKDILNVLFRLAIQRESTIPDAAAIIMYGPDLAEKAGDYAAVNRNFRRGIDMVTGGTENPALAFALAAAPLALQAYRNHQEYLSPSAAIATVRENRKAAKQRPAKRLKIPFTGRYIEFRFQWKLFKIEAVTNDPQALAVHVFTNPEILQSLEKAGITLPFEMGSPNGATGKRSTKA